MTGFHNAEIAHEAIVQSNDRGSVTLLLLNKGSCSGCSAEKSCGMSENSTKEINIEGSYDVSPGSRVTVLMKQSSGFMALFLGYLLPLLLFIVSIVLLSIFSVAELTAGLIALGVLIPYYIFLTFFRKSMRQQFSFTIKHQD